MHVPVAVSDPPGMWGGVGLSFNLRFYSGGERGGEASEQWRK